MVELTWPAALLAGLLGSGHCVAMCGGMALLPGAASEGRRGSRVVLFNLARVSSYAAAGALVGVFGATLADLFPIAGGARIMRALTALMVIVIASSLLWPRFRFGPLERAGGRIWRRTFAPLARRLRPGQSLVQLIALGALWGWLPCGLVYTLLLTAALTDSAWAGATTMAMFGLGTLPAMLGIGMAGAGAAHLSQKRAWAGGLLLAGGLWWLATALWVPGHQHSHNDHHQHTVGMFIDGARTCA